MNGSLKEILGLISVVALPILAIIILIAATVMFGAKGTLIGAILYSIITAAILLWSRDIISSNRPRGY